MSFGLLKQLPYYLICIAFLAFGSCESAIIENPDHPDHFNGVFDIANRLVFENNPKRAIHIVDSSYQAFDNPGPGDVWRRYRFMANYCFSKKEDLQAAMIYADSMEVILAGMESKYPRQYLESLLTQGDIFIAMNDFRSSLELYYKGAEFASANLDSCDYVGLSARQGSVRYKQGKYEEAIDYFKRAAKEFNGCKISKGYYDDVIIPQSGYNTIALAYEKLGVPDSAIHYYNEALQFIDHSAPRYPEETRSMQNARGVIYGNLGGTYFLAGKNREAEEFLKKSIEINGPNGFRDRDAITACVKLSTLYLSESRIKEAGALISDFEEMSSDGTDEIKMKWLKQKLDYFDKQGDLENAYKHAILYHTAKDRFDDTLSQLKQIDFNSQTQNLEQRYALEKLKSNDQMKSLYLFVTIVFLSMTSLIAFILLKNGKRSKKLITELRKVNLKAAEQNKELHISLRLLEKSQEENTRMLKIVAHDLRNPIGGIQGISDIMLDDKRITAEQQEMIRMIRTAAVNSLELINDLMLTNTRQEDLQREAVDLFVVINYCVDMLRPAALAKNQEIIVDADHVVTQVSREKMWRVISNLIGNAIKFSQQDGAIHINLKSTDQKVLISVTDNGIGIPDDVKDMIFNLFTSAKRSGTSGEQSFGLGLAISKQIVEAHGGKIWFESIENQGTTFYIELPLI